MVTLHLYYAPAGIAGGIHLGTQQYSRLPNRAEILIYGDAKTTILHSNKGPPVV